MSYIRYSAGNHNWYIYATDDTKGTTYLEIDYQFKEFIRFDLDDNKIKFIENYHDNYSTCNCEVCQVGRKFPEVQYAYYYAKYYFAKYVLDILKKQKVKFSFEKLADKKGNYLNEFGCVCQDTLACGEYMEEMEKDYPELKNFIKK